MVGIVGAATVTMSLIALPAMLKRNYKTSLAIGCISGGGGLGFLIPPSVTMIVYASLSNLSIGKMFLAAIIPGFMLASLFIAYILIRSLVNPELAPPIEEQNSGNGGTASSSLILLGAPVSVVSRTER